jgi:hypothetical protein
VEQPHPLSERELKTDAACREVVLMPQLAAVLREHRMASRFKGAGELPVRDAGRSGP